MKWQQALQKSLLGLSLGLLLGPSVGAIGSDQTSRLVNFSLSTTVGLAPLEVQFEDQSTVPGTGLSYLWDFGDGNTSTQHHPVHTYTEPGVYDVLLQVSSSDGTYSKLKKDAVEAHDVLMFTGFEESQGYDDHWDPIGPVSWTNSPALLGAGSLAVDIQVVGHDAPEMNGDDGMVVAGGGSGSGCPVPPLNCRGDVVAEIFGTFSFYFDLGEVVAGDGSYFRIFRLNEGYAEGPSLVDVLVHKVGKTFFLQYVVSQAGGDVNSALIPVSAARVQHLEITWVSGKATTNGLGLFQATLSSDNAFGSQDAPAVTTIYNLDNDTEVFDFWQIGMFESFFYQQADGRVIFDEFSARRSMPDSLSVDSGP